MSGLKVLAKETAIYGLGTIVVRFMSWVLTPFYTFVLSTESDLGKITNIYAITALLLVFLTYGMETGFFRFVNKKEWKENVVYSTTLLSVGFTTLIFVLLLVFFNNSIAHLLFYDAHPEYLFMMFLVVAMDAFSCIPFAWLRYQKRPIRFIFHKLLYVVLNILFNVWFLLVCPYLANNGYGYMVNWFYQSEWGVGYVFLANLLATFIQTLSLTPYLLGFKYQLNWTLLRQMLRYSFPLLILGIAGIMSQTIDKIMMPYLIADKESALAQLGLYGVAVKIAVVLTMFTQAFRFAYEPFVFGKYKQDGEKSTQAYAEAMKYYVMCTLFIFLGVSFYLDLLKYLTAPPFWEALWIVPIVMAGDVFMGIFFNLSLWYKLNDQTQWGAYFSLLGFAIIVLINILLVPTYGYAACAWGIFFAYLVMMLASYFIGQKRYPIPYDLKRIGIYVLLTLSLFGLGQFVCIENIVLRLSYRTLLLFVFIAFSIRKDVPLQTIPIVNRLIKK